MNRWKREMFDEIELIPGDSAVDDRGKLQFCNSFDMTDVKRFYVVSNHTAPFVRAWHAHKHEMKYVYAVSGAALIAAVRIDDWDQPDPAADVARFVVSEDKPGILRIPGGYAHGFMSLRSDTRLMFFSTSGLDDSVGDDYRYPFDYWNPWAVTPR